MTNKIRELFFKTAISFLNLNNINYQLIICCQIYFNFWISSQTKKKFIWTLCWMRARFCYQAETSAVLLQIKIELFRLHFIILMIFLLIMVKNVFMEWQKHAMSIQVNIFTIYSFKKMNYFRRPSRDVRRCVQCVVCVIY